MATSLERRIDALECRDSRSLEEMTDRELLAIVAPDSIGPMLSDDVVQAMCEACLNNSPTKGGEHGEP
jgi:hypothetical protein